MINYHIKKNELSRKKIASFYFHIYKSIVIIIAKTIKSDIIDLKIRCIPLNENNNGIVIR